MTAHLTYVDLEDWKPVVGFEGRYAISSLGRVRSFVRGAPAHGRLLKPGIASTGYVDCDFETSSAADLKLVGADAYAQDPTTEILVLVYGEHCWWPGEPAGLLGELARDPNVIFVAHNAAFEQAIWRWIMVRRYGFAPLPVERWEDTMATAAWKATPLALDKLAPALRLPVEKDKDGNRLTLSMSRPDKKTGMYPERSPERLDRIAQYCAQDVAVESAVRHKIGLLSEQSPQERGIWLLDQRINQRGVRIDLDFVGQAQRVVDRATVPLLAEFRDLTGGVNPGQVAKVIEWAGRQGVELENLQKGYLSELLEGTDDDTDAAGYASLAGEEGDEGLQSVGEPDVLGLPGAVRRVLEIRGMLGSTSIKKLARMRACVGYDGRARGLLQYHAAGPGRWGGRLFQPQNFPRPDYRGDDDRYRKVDPAAAVEAIMTGDPAYVEMVLGAPAIECVAFSLRHALVPDPGKLFCVGDFAGIEARIVLALAGQMDRVAEMAAGRDVYCDMASGIYRRPITKADHEQRQAGKAAVLGAGFQMGAARFKAAAKTQFEADLTEAQAEAAIRSYRKEWAPRVPGLWYGLERAALQAVEHGKGEAYGVTYRHMGEWLVAELPSGWQRLHYHRPEPWYDEVFDKQAWKYRAYKGGKLSHVKAYGGLLTENAVQGLARGLLAASMMRLERAGYPIVLTVHDECVCEVDEDKAGQAQFGALMTEPTPWAERIGIPVAVESWVGDRYRK